MNNFLQKFTVNIQDNRQDNRVNIDKHDEFVSLHAAAYWIQVLGTIPVLYMGEISALFVHGNYKRPIRHFSSQR